MMDKKTLRIASLAIALVIIAGLIYTYNGNTGSTNLVLTVTSTQSAYSILNGDMVTLSLDMPPVDTEPFEVTYWINGNKIYVASGVVSDSFNIGIRVNEGS
ncbi:MAG: hypothetical protein WC325_12040, partial [Candidatus Bathyarchaeia archaeon]